MRNKNINDFLIFIHAYFTNLLFSSYFRNFDKSWFCWNQRHWIWTLKVSVHIAHSRTNWWFLFFDINFEPKNISIHFVIKYFSSRIKAVTRIFSSIQTVQSNAFNSKRGNLNLNIMSRLEQLQLTLQDSGEK